MWQTIRKLGLEYCDLPTMLWNVSSMLRYLALDIDPRNKRPVGIFSYICLMLIGACYYYVYLVSMAWFVFVRCPQTGDVFSAIIVFSLGASSEISMTKLLCMFGHRTSIRKIISSFLACDAQVAPNSRFAANIKTTLRAVKKRAIIVWSVININGIIYILIPFFFSERRLMEDEFLFFGFESIAEMKTSPYYEITFIINIVAVYVTCFPAANISSLFIITAGYIEAQMLALSHELTSLHEDALKNYESNNSVATSHLRDTYRANIQSEVAFEDSSVINNYYTTSGVKDVHRGRISNSIEGNASIQEGISKNSRQEYINEYIRKRLEDIVKSHTTNINLLQQIEGVFRFAIALEFMLLIIGLIAELLGGLEKTYIELPFALMSVSIDCLVGQRIKDASEVFQKAVYDSKWENFNVANRKTVLMMLRCSQRAMKLSAGSVSTLSLECLMVVLKSAYSAYTTLRSTMKKI